MCPDRRRTVATLEASDALRAHERLLLHEAEVKLRQRPARGVGPRTTPAPARPGVRGTAHRSRLGRRLRVPSSSASARRLTAGADPQATAATATDLADRVLRQLEFGANVVHGRDPAPGPCDTGWPQHVRRAG